METRRLIAIAEKRSASAKTLLFLTFVGALFGAVTWRILYTHERFYNEFVPHLQIAARMEAAGRPISPHFVFQFLAISTNEMLKALGVPGHALSESAIIDSRWLVSCLLVMVAIYVATAILLLRYLQSPFLGSWVYPIAFGLMFVAPIFVLAPLDRLYYTGYITPSTIFIIPTQPLLKLTTVAWMLNLPLLWTRGGRPWQTWLFAALTVFNGLAKPNFLIVMVPALLVLLAVRRFTNWQVAAAVLLAALLVLTWQFEFHFISSEAGYSSKVVLTRPFAVLSHSSDFLLAKLLLSLAFPLTVVAFFWREVRRSTEFAFAAIVAGIGLLFGIFVGEAGPEFYSGNFVWSAQIGLFVLFATSAKLVFCTRAFTEERRAPVLIAAVVFSLHVGCGLIYYARSFSEPFT